jgi:CRP/FNR family cyclic AMP-dependent transcriptional regulator
MRHATPSPANRSSSVPTEASQAPPVALRGVENGAWGAVRLLDVDPEFAVGPLDGDRIGLRGLVVPSLRPADGPWAPPDVLARAVGVVVLGGILVGAGTTFARPDVRLLGPGDMLDGRTLTSPETAWRVLRPAHLAVLDGTFVLAGRRWPALIAGLARRLSQAQQEQHIRAAICAMPRVEERILALLCHLAHRWGHVTPDGITLTLPMTHELLGSLIGARRPTVSLAIRALTEQRLLRRHDDIWILPPDCSTWPASGIPRGPVDELPSGRHPGRLER